MTPSKALHRACQILFGATVALIFVGGLVKSTDSGLAVPDWPLSYGRFMPPMIGGILFEHGHRMVAATIGFLTVLLAVFFTVKEKRAWLKRAAWGAVGLVILQGTLGGLTVLFRLPAWISILHACTAQTFLCLVVALTVWTSSTWIEREKVVIQPQGPIPLPRFTVALFGLCYAQLIFGAVLRHSGWGLIPHITTAIMILALSCYLRWALKKMVPTSIQLNRLGTTLVIAVFTQVALGLTTYFLLGHEFKVIPVPFPALFTITLHVMMGAVVLALATMLALRTFDLKPLTPYPNTPTKLADYFELTKPGITMTAGITALAGFVLGSEGHVNLLQLWHTSIGTLLIAAGAGTLNMLIEKDIDARMKRTKRRPLPAGRLKPGEALFVGCLLSVSAIVYLSWAVNITTAIIAGITLSVYLYVYTPLKKVSSVCITVGAVAGALPPVIGWTAATGHLGVEAWVLFGILFFWQFPHFFSLAWLYKEDYSQAGLHMLPHVNDNGNAAAFTMFINSVALLVVSLIPTWMGLTGYFYLGTALILGLWLIAASFLFFKTRTIAQARKLFFASLFYIPLLVTAMVLNNGSHLR